MSEYVPQKPSLRKRRIDDPNPLACIHRGAWNGLIDCPTCKGRVQLKVFACDLFGRCTLEKRAGGLPVCAECRKRKPRATGVVGAPA